MNSPPSESVPCAPDMCVYVAPDCPSVIDRITMSVGSRAAGTVEERVIGYEEQARLPALPWRALTQAEARRFVRGAPSDMTRTIAVVRLPDLPCRLPMASADRENWLGLLDSINRVASIEDPIDIVGITSNAVGLQTVTFNEQIEKFIGLHVDNWEGAALLNREALPNRLCVNIGSSHRYFLFVPCSLCSMIDVLERVHGRDWQIPPRLTSIGRLFLEEYPSFPVIRCKVLPGEAYIAPTENLVHDASSDGHTGVEDRQFTVRGNIDLRWQYGDRDGW